MSDGCAIQLHSKWDGRVIWLGVMHPTHDAAKAYAEKNVCLRCNRIEIHPFPAEWVWIGKERGYAPSSDAS